MKEDLRSRLSEYKNGIPELFRNGYHSDPEDRRRSFLIWGLSFFAGLIIASVICFFIEFYLIKRSTEAKYDLAGALPKRAPSLVHYVTADPYRNFSDLNPMAALMPDKGNANSGGMSSEIKEMDLVGTLPGIGAWIRDRSSTRFIIKGGEINGCSLDSVGYLEVVLLKNKEKHILFMNISTGNITPPQKVSGRSLPKNTPVKKSTPKAAHPGIEPASEGVEGVVPRELVDKLLMDPYAEIAKMRMVPAEGGGMQLARIDADSVLGLVGVQKNDIIKAVNGVEISNLSDATNAVNSMMSGTRFDVKVERSGKPLELKYQVK